MTGAFLKRPATHATATDSVLQTISATSRNDRLGQPVSGPKGPTRLLQGMHQGILPQDSNRLFFRGEGEGWGGAGWVSEVGYEILKATIPRTSFLRNITGDGTS